jgi:hypothetical protein
MPSAYIPTKNLIIFHTGIIGNYLSLIGIIKSIPAERHKDDCQGVGPFQGRDFFGYNWFYKGVMPSA